MARSCTKALLYERNGLPVIGLDTTLRNLAAMGRRLSSEGDDFMLREGQRVLDNALQRVPHDSGDLARSGEVKRTGGNVGAGVGRQLFARDARGRFTSGSVEVAFGKSGPSQAYALSVHETPSEHDPPTWQGKTVSFQNGGQAKFLERAFNETLDGTNARLAAHLKSRLGG